MVLKGLPDDYKPFGVFNSQSERQLTFCEFKAAWRSFDDTERGRVATENGFIMKAANGHLTLRLSNMRSIPKMISPVTNVANLGVLHVDVRKE